MIRKQWSLSETKSAGGRTFTTTMYDASVLDLDGETMNPVTFRPVGRITLQIDHDWSVEKTVGWCDGVHWAGRKLRGTMTFAPEGVSELADQIYRQVAAGITATVSVGFSGDLVENVYQNVELYELSLVSVPASPGARVDGKALSAWLRGDDGEDMLAGVGDEGGEELGDGGEQLIVLSGEPFGDPMARRQHVEGGDFDIDDAELAAALRQALRDVMGGLAGDVRSAVAQELARRRGRID